MTPCAAATALAPSVCIDQEEYVTAEVLTHMQRQFQKQGNSRAKRIHADMFWHSEGTACR